VAIEDIGQAAQAVADALSALGVPAAVDGRDLQLPGAWVTPAAVRFDYLSGDRIAVDWDIYLITRDIPSVQAMDELGAMAVKIAKRFGHADFTPQTVTIANQSADPLPALLVTLPSDLS